MGRLVVVLGVLQFFAGIVFFMEAASAIHQILGAISFGMGILSVAMGTAVQQLVAIKRALTPAAPVDAEAAS